MLPFDLTSRTVLVTGSSSGIGREMAIVLSQLGAHVILTGRKPAELESTRAQMGDGDHHIEPFDLIDLEAIPDWVKRLTSRFGPLHGMVHAAGIRKTVALRGLSLPTLQETFRVNVDTAVMLAKGFRQKGCCAKNASIVLISSVAALSGSSAACAYAASKAALIGLTRSLAIELASERIRVNCLCPGIVNTGMTDDIRKTLSDEMFASLVAQYPLGIGTAWDVACGAAYLLAEASRWMTGQTLVVDGGFSAQ